jgi:hypothetical protein
MDMPTQGLHSSRICGNHYSVHLLLQETDRKRKSSRKSAEIQIFMAHPRIERGAAILRIVNNGMWRYQVLCRYYSPLETSVPILYFLIVLCTCRKKSAIERGSTIVQNIGGMKREGTQHYRSSALSFESRACVPNFHSVVKTKNVILSNDLPPNGTGVLL